MKIDKIIYPDENGTAIWYKRNRYDVVCGNITTFFYNWEVIRLLEFLIEQDVKGAKTE